jgi:hypothetical protein
MAGANDESRIDAPFHLVADWVKFHGLDLGAVSRIVSIDRYTDQSREAVSAQTKQFTLSMSDRGNCYKNLVIPALSRFASDGSDLSAVRFDYLSPEARVPPYTMQTDAGPIIVMGWRSRLEDLICLAHESGHALQLINGRRGNVPPLMRETAAFLSELLLESLKNLPALA